MYMLYISYIHIDPFFPGPRFDISKVTASMLCRGLQLPRTVAHNLHATTAEKTFVLKSSI